MSPAPRVAVTTGATDPELLGRVKSLGCDAVYAKPLDAAVIAAWLTAGGSSAAPTSSSRPPSA